MAMKTRVDIESHTGRSRTCSPPVNVCGFSPSVSSSRRSNCGLVMDWLPGLAGCQTRASCIEDEAWLFQYSDLPRIGAKRRCHAQREWMEFLRALLSFASAKAGHYLEKKGRHYSATDAAGVPTDSGGFAIARQR